MDCGNNINICLDYNELIYWHIPTMKYSTTLKNEWTVLKAMLDEENKLQMKCDINVILLSFKKLCKHKSCWYITT